MNGPHQPVESFSFGDKRRVPKIDIVITRERDKGVVVGEELDEVPYEVGGGAAGMGPGF